MIAVFLRLLSHLFVLYEHHKSTVLSFAGVLWMDYILAIQGLVVILLMGFVKEEYRRTSIDKVPEQQTGENSTEA